MDNLTISREMDEQLYTALASSTEITGAFPCDNRKKVTEEKYFVFL